MRGALALIAGCGLLACAATVGRPQQLPDGTYQLACQTRLSTCLTAMDNICFGHGYDVLTANERRTNRDVPQALGETITSEAHVACKQGEPLFGHAPTSAPPAPADGGASQ